MYIFPGMGLGALCAKALKVTDEMFLSASKALSGMVTPEQEAQGMLLPDVKGIREVSFTVALAVAKEARDAGLGRLLDDSDLEKVIHKAQWEPIFNPYRPG
jgi:malate dehydrogenase (oxaloacetate-decarboxylating)